MRYGWQPQVLVSLLNWLVSICQYDSCVATHGISSSKAHSNLTFPPPAGLVALLAAKAFGADAVAVTDLKPSNLRLARQLGVDYTHQCGVGELPQATAEALRQGAAAPGGFQVSREGDACRAAGSLLPRSRRWKAGARVAALCFGAFRLNRVNKGQRGPAARTAASCIFNGEDIALQVVIDCAGFEATMRVSQASAAITHCNASLQPIARPNRHYCHTVLLKGAGERPNVCPRKTQNVHSGPFYPFHAACSAALRTLSASATQHSHPHPSSQALPA